MKVLFENIDQYRIQNIISRNDERSWPLHFHSHIEIFVVRKGNYLININGKNYNVGDGSLIIFDHYDLHSLEELSKRIDDCIIRIPNGSSSKFDKARMKLRIENPIICDRGLVDNVLNVVDSMNLDLDDPFIISTSIEYILMLIYRRLQFTEVVKGAESEAEYARRIMLYISDHYREKITTATIAKDMGYSREHISRIFHSYFKDNIQTYVNNKRIEYIEERHRETGKNAPRSFWRRDLDASLHTTDF